MPHRDIINELISDHWLMRDLIKELRGKKVRSDRKQTLLRRLGAWIRAHSHGEEKTIGPFGEAHRATQILAYEDSEEHQTIELLLRKLEHTHSNQKLRSARLHLLCELLEHHLDEEEEEYFPVLREQLTADQSEKMAEQYRSLTEELDHDRPHPKPGLFGWLSSRPDTSSPDIGVL